MPVLERLTVYIEVLVNMPVRYYSAISTLMVAIVLVTPLCGVLFQCGCDWPWSELDSLCNFYELHAQHHCPWCVSMVTGVVSAGLAVILGSWATLWSSVTFSNGVVMAEFGFRMLMGIVVFISIAIFCAGIAAYLQAYPLGIGRFIGE